MAKQKEPLAGKTEVYPGKASEEKAVGLNA